MDSKKLLMIGMTYLVTALVPQQSDYAVNGVDDSGCIERSVSQGFQDFGSFGDLEDLALPYINVESRIKNSREHLEAPNYYESFKFPDEIPNILKHAEIEGVEPELLMAIRMAENGEDVAAYGILPSGNLMERYLNDKGYNYNGEFNLYSGSREKQLSWAAATVHNHLERFNENPGGYGDFLSYLASKYAPINANNDPTGLNNHWESNVRELYQRFKGVSVTQ